MVQVLGLPGMVAPEMVTLLGEPLFQVAPMVPLQLPRIDEAPMPAMLIELPPFGVIVQGKPDGLTRKPHCQSGPALKEPPVMVADLPSAATEPLNETSHRTVVDCCSVRQPHHEVESGEYTYK